MTEAEPHTSTRAYESFGLAHFAWCTSYGIAGRAMASFLGRLAYMVDRDITGAGTLKTAALDRDIDLMTVAYYALSEHATAMSGCLSDEFSIDEWRSQMPALEKLDNRLFLPVTVVFGDGSSVRIDRTEGLDSVMPPSVRMVRIMDEQRRRSTTSSVRPS